MRTLVLNAGYEPLAVVSFRRALLLVLNQKATVLQPFEQQKVRTCNQEFDMPSVILLTRYVRIPGMRKVPLSRRGVLRRDSHRCVYCGRSANTVDHVIPKSRGGGDSWENLVACCLKCNNTKSDRTLAEIGWTLPFTPRMPSSADFTLRGAEKLEPEWFDYLAMSSAAA